MDSVISCKESTLSQQISEGLSQKRNGSCSSLTNEVAFSEVEFCVLIAGSWKIQRNKNSQIFFVSDGCVFQNDSVLILFCRRNIQSNCLLIAMHGTLALFLIYILWLHYMVTFANGILSNRDPTLLKIDADIRVFLPIFSLLFQTLSKFYFGVCVCVLLNVAMTRVLCTIAVVPKFIKFQVGAEFWLDRWSFGASQPWSSGQG